MPWAVPNYSKTKVDNAGRAYVDDAATPSEREAALAIINNWRSSHSFPLNTMQVALRRYTRQVSDEPLIAQRLKRLPSIDAKLRRFSGQRLSQMQDIGGARAVVETVDQVYAVVDRFKRSEIRHVLANEDDYVDCPRDSGYRSYHLMYRYNSDRNETYNGLRIELQVRSRYQHAWATAVETVGTFTLQALKSSQGEEDWLRFFALMGSAIALREKMPTVPGTPVTQQETRSELRDYAAKLGVVDRLSAYGSALQALDESITGTFSDYFLLELDTVHSTLSIRGFDKRSLDFATESYLEAEKFAKEGQGRDAVLVSVDSIAALRRAYPNYFADTSVFLGIVKQEVK